MTHKYFYDNSGLPTSYLLLTILIPITLLQSYKYLQKRTTSVCKCIKCIKHKKTKQSRVQILILALLFTLISYLIKNVLTIKHKSQGFNPYEVLGIEPEYTKMQLKSAFRKLALKNDPHKFEGEKKVEAENNLREIVKAYNLINEGVKIDSEGSVELMAIPDWLVTKSSFLLFFYFFLLGILLPRFAYFKYKNSNTKNRFNVLYKTTDTFYYLILGESASMINKSIDKPSLKMVIDSAFLKSEGCIRGLISFITNSDDLLNYSYKKRINIKSLVEEKFGYPIKESNIPYFILMDHLFRTEKSDHLDLLFVQNKTLEIIQSLKEVALKKENLLLLERLFTLERMVIQAVFDEEYWEMQGDVSFEELFLRKKTKSKSSFVENSKLPSLKISKIKAFVEKSNLLEEDSIFKDDCFILPENSKVTVSFNLELVGNKLIHAPFLKEDLFVNWAVYLLIDNNIIDFKEVKENKLIKFTFDGKNKPMAVKLLFKNGYYFNVDKEENINLKFKPIKKTEE